MHHVYNNHYMQTLKLQRDLRPALSGQNNYQTRQLNWQLRELGNAFANREDPHAINVRLKGIEKHMTQMQNSGNTLPKDHSADLYQNMSTMRQSFQAMPRYYKK